MSSSITKETQTSVEKQVKEPSKEQAKDLNKEQAEEPVCGICYIALDNKNTVITTCDHAYCTTCFFKWLNRKETCALCRKVLLSDIVVEERLTALQDVQEELMDNYRCLRVLKRNIKKKKCKKNNLTDDINSLINRQIRMRYLLQQTRSVCRETLTRSRFLKQAMEMQKKSLDLMKNYRSEWEDLHTPLLAPTEEEAEEEAEEEEIDVVNMTAALDNMIRLESRRARAALQRMRERAALLANAEIIEVENSDDDNNEDAAEEDTAEQDTAEEDTAEQDTAEQDTAEQDTADYFEDEEGIELDLTVFGTGIPTFDFMPAPRRTVRVPARNHRQSPMFVFGDTAMPPASAFETPTNNPETQSTTLPLTPPIIEMTRTPVEPTDSLQEITDSLQEITDSLQESGFEWTPINLEISGTMTRLVARPEMEPADTEESITDE